MTIASEYLAAAGWHNAGDVAGFQIARAYRFWRRAKYPAGEALAKARADFLAGRARYLPESSRGGGVGASGERWFERPESTGFRFVGWSDELAGLNHRGWFLYPDGDPDDSARGCVYQLPARRGVCLFVEAIRTGSTDRNGEWRDMGTDGGALIFLRDVHRDSARDFEDASDMQGARDAARGADREAESYGEREREYQRAWQAGADAASAVEDAKGARIAARALLGEIRGRVASDMPATCQAVRERISALLAGARANYSKAREAWRENGEPWKPSAWQISYAASQGKAVDAPGMFSGGRHDELAAAFREGAGATTWRELVR